MLPQHSSVLFQVPARGLRRRDLQSFARRLQDEVAKGRMFTCMIASDEDLRQWNQQFRKKDYATDVLSFPSATVDSLGEIAISYDRALEQAEECGHGVEEEVRILLLHGVLHLMGFDHEKDSGEMARAERRWRKKLELPSGLIERTAQ
jgi:probable rRNA maturation factor